MFSKRRLEILVVLGVLVGASLWASHTMDPVEARGDHGLSLWQGLPKTLPWTYGRNPSFVHYDQYEGTSFAPLAAQATLNGARVNTSRDREVVEKLFHEEFTVFIPKAIQVSKVVGVERWDYPVGFELLHRIEFHRSNIPAKQKLFELRMVRKISATRYAYGIYVPDCSTAECVLVLKTVDIRDVHTYEFEHEEFGPVRFDVKALGLATCQRCHFMMSPSRTQYVSQEEAGPCGFGPANLSLKGEWAKDFTKLQGFSPFQIVSEI